MRRAEWMVVLGALGVGACKAPPRAEPAPCTSGTAQFEPGPPPTGGLFVVGEGTYASAFERVGTTSLLRYRTTTFELRGDELVGRRDLDRPDAAPAIGVGRAPWKNGSTLTLAPVGRTLTGGFGFSVNGSSDRTPIVRSGIRFSAMSALPSGEVFAVGDDQVERWPADGSASVIETLPTRKGRDAPTAAVVFARSATEVWVGGWDFHERTQLPYLARFDGTKWKVEDAPGSGAVSAIAFGPDGTMWFTADALHWREPGGTFTGSPVPMPLDAPTSTPPGIDRDGLLAVGRGDVWLSVRWGDRAIVVHTRPGNGVLDLDDGTRIDFVQAKKRWTTPLPW